MNYNALIRDAWSTTMHHRFLWVLGLFTGAAVGTCSGIGNSTPLQYRTTSPDLTRAVPAIETSAAEAGRWLANHAALVGGALVLLAVFGLVLLIVSFIAQGGMTEATIDLARHQPTSLGRAWHMGRHFFWRFVGLALVPVFVAIMLGALGGSAVAVAMATSNAVNGAAQTGLIALWIVAGVVAIVVLIPFAVAFSIVLAYAQRAIVAENVSPIEAVRIGSRVLLRHLGDSLLVWLITIGLGIVANLAIIVTTVIVGVILVGVGLVVWSALGFTVITGIYLAGGVAGIIAVFWGLEAIANVFFWDFWTLAYLELTGAASGPTR